MAYRLPGGRVPLVFDDGPFAGLRVEVEPISSWSVYRYAVTSVAAFFAAPGPEAEFAALRVAFGLFVDEAQPTWEIVNHKGPVPPTEAGMLRLPLALGLALCEQWTDTYVGVEEEEETETAVDEVYPPGGLRDQLNAVLARKRAEAA